MFQEWQQPNSKIGSVNYIYKSRIYIHIYMRDLAGAKFRLGVGVNHFAIASV